MSYLSVVLACCVCGMEVLSMLVLCCVLNCVIPRSSAEPYTLTDEEYGRMPPLMSLEEYHGCVRRPGGRYCSAYGTYVADGDSTLLTIMQKYSEHSCSRFNHTRAFFGRCLDNCKVEDKTSDPKHLLEECLNRTVWDQYRLKVKLDSKVHCDEHGEKKPDIRTADIVVAAIIIGLVICNAVGSLFDVYCQDKWKNSFVGQFLLCFSVPRNWGKLTAPPDPKLDSLKGIYGIRAISTSLVIMAHGLLPVMVGLENPKFIEDLYDWYSTHILLNGSLIMQTFLFLSAFLMVYCSGLHEIDLSWNILPMALLKRWLRLTPSYMLMLAVTATWLPYMGSGPIWNLIVVEESASCRHNWWQHPLYINNYFDDSLCMRQTWYVSADLQLYCVGALVLASCRSPRSRRLLLSALLLLALLVPALHTYCQDLDGLLLASPATGAVLFFNDRTFDHIYKRGHTNLASYILGLAAGAMVLHLQSNNFNINKYKALRLLYWSLFPLGVAITISCKILYVSPRVSVWYRALAAALVRPVFGLLMGAIVVGLVLNIGSRSSVYRRVLECRVWVPLARVSYSAYLLHVAYIRVTFGSLDRPIHMTLLRGSEMALFTVVVVNVLATVFWLTVEAPLSHVVNSCLQTNSKLISLSKKSIKPTMCDKIESKVESKKNKDY